MTHREFNHLLTSLNGLSPEQMRELVHALETKMAATGSRGDPADDETAFDVANRAGVIGCIKGAPRSPTDLSTNPKHMEGFGRA